MDLRPLGNSGLRVSVLGLGTVKLGRNRGVKYPGGEGFALPTDEQAAALLRAAADLGINFIDTAPAYGAAEDRLGALMHANNWFGGRARWVLCTKAGEEFDPATGQSRFDFSPRAITASVERSLRKLRTDTLDLVLLHCDHHDEWEIMHSGAMDALAALKRRGLIRAIGASTKSIDAGLCAIRDTCAGAATADVLMLAYGPGQRDQGVVIESALHRAVGVLVKKGLASGHVHDLLAKMPPDIRAATDDPIEAAMRFTLTRRGVSSMVVGTASVDHLKANAAAAARATGRR